MIAQLAALPLPFMVRPRFARMFTTDIPDLDNPIWESATAALLAKIEISNGAMTIDDIVAWSTSNGDSGSVIRHKLAWLSVKNRVTYDPQRKVWRIP